MLRRALELGVNLIDTADSYGPEVSETLIAEALHPYPEGLVIATKAGFTRQGPRRWSADGRPERLRAACEASLRRLRLERIDLFYLHTVDPAVPLEDSLGALAELRAEGKIRLAAVSNVDAAQLERARAVVPVAAVQNRLNLAERDAEPVLEACEREGTPFVAWAPLAKGFFAGARRAAPPRSRPTRCDARAGLARVAARVLAGHGRDPRYRERRAPRGEPRRRRARAERRGRRGAGAAPQPRVRGRRLARRARVGWGRVKRRARGSGAR